MVESSGTIIITLYNVKSKNDFEVVRYKEYVMNVSFPTRSGGLGWGLVGW